MERRTETLALPRAWCPKGLSVSHPPPHRAVHTQMRLLGSYKAVRDIAFHTCTKHLPNGSCTTARNPNGTKSLSFGRRSARLCRILIHATQPSLTQVLFRNIRLYLNKYSALHNKFKYSRNPTSKTVVYLKTLYSPWHTQYIREGRTTIARIVSCVFSTPLLRHCRQNV
jgi:hypothetical protein